MSLSYGHPGFSWGKRGVRNSKKEVGSVIVYMAKGR